MKDEIRKSHGHQKTKEVFTFDDGLAEQQGPFLSVAGPILAALMLLDLPPNKEGEGGTRSQHCLGDARGCSGHVRQCQHLLECLAAAMLLRFPYRSGKANLARRYCDR